MRKRLLKDIPKESTVSDSVDESCDQPRSRYLLSLTELEWAGLFVSEALEKDGLKCELVDLGSHGKGIVVTAKLTALVEKAEALEWTREVKDSEEVCVIRQFDMDRLINSDGDNFFTSAEEVKLLFHLIQDIRVNKDELAKKGCNMPSQRKDFISALKHSSPPLIEEAYPLHHGKEKRQLIAMLKRAMLPTIQLDLAKIRSYFGEEVAFYFSWMQFYSLCALVPAVVGVAMYAMRSSGDTVDTDPYLPFFSVFMSIWAVLFLVFWRRKSFVNSFHWNTYKFSSKDQRLPGYHGDKVIDPVSKREIIYYRSWKRNCWYLFSFLAMLPLLGLGLGAMTLSLNLNGYVKNTASPIYVAALARYAQPGGLFASDSPYYLWLVPTLAHSIIIYFINQLYGMVAKKCTDLENHRTEGRWHASMVIKRVTFECVDCFMPLFYIAFYQLDIITLRAEIASLFMSDEIRRVVMESVIPFVGEIRASRVERSKYKGRKVIPDTTLAEYDQFDDYLEMVVQFGYITLFASALPLGSAVTLLFLYIEARSDLFKLLYAYRRPPPRRTRDIGVWYDVMGVIVFIGILSNCAILGFSSEQLMQWLPSLFDRAELGNQVMAVGSGRYVVGLVFSFEHILLVVAVWLQWAIKPRPKWVRLAIARRDYLTREKLLRQASLTRQVSLSQQPSLSRQSSVSPP